MVPPGWFHSYDITKANNRDKQISSFLWLKLGEGLMAKENGGTYRCFNCFIC